LKFLRNKECVPCRLKFYKLRGVSIRFEEMTEREKEGKGRDSIYLIVV